MATDQNNINPHYAHLLAGLKGTPGASARVVKHSQPMPLASAENASFTGSDYANLDDPLRDLVKELTCPGSQISR